MKSKWLFLMGLVLLDKKVTVMVCPTCLKAAGRVPDDLAPGIQIADKDRFFNFTKAAS